MKPKAIDVKPLKDYVLELTFDNGKKKYWKIPKNTNQKSRKNYLNNRGVGTYEKENINYYTSNFGNYKTPYIGREQRCMDRNSRNDFKPHNQINHGDDLI